jgi:hypothetical protein
MLSEQSIFSDVLEKMNRAYKQHEIEFDKDVQA